MPTTFPIRLRDTPRNLKIGSAVWRQAFCVKSQEPTLSWFDLGFF
jgi:hypothetical protein